MRNTIILFALLVFTNISFGQVDISNWEETSPDNITVMRLEGDSLTTSFLIQVRKDVPLHYHAKHSEHVYIIKGEGIFTMNDKKNGGETGDVPVYSIRKPPRR